MSNIIKDENCSEKMPKELARKSSILNIRYFGNSDGSKRWVQIAKRWVDER